MRKRARSAEFRANPKFPYVFNRREQTADFTENADESSDPPKAPKALPISAKSASSAVSYFRRPTFYGLFWPFSPHDAASAKRSPTGRGRPRKKSEGRWLGHRAADDLDRPAAIGKAVPGGDAWPLSKTLVNTPDCWPLYAISKSGVTIVPETSSVLPGKNVTPLRLVKGFVVERSRAPNEPTVSELTVSANSVALSVPPFTARADSAESAPTAPATRLPATVVVLPV